MDLKTFLSPMTQDEREAFARRCGTSRGHLQNVAYGKTCAPALATAIEIHSGRQVTRPELRDDWRSIWPELASGRRAPRVVRTGPQSRASVRSVEAHPAARAKLEAKGRC